jgi:hypothetical protein
MSFIDDVRAKRQKLADVLADEDYSGIREIVEELYPDRAHFIYELLQNAEDVGATEARFTLEEHSVVFVHNGRPFNEKDVWGITNIGKGTKKDQEDQIGRFGVGFKAVFAYSESPHIWSPTYAFKISDLVLPSEIPAKPELGQLTCFEFPFNSPKKPTATAYSEVRAGLQELAETTLLFLSRLQSIRWQIGQTPPGEVLRAQHPNNHVEVLKRSGTKTVSSSHFLRLSRPVEGLEKQVVSIAFPLDCLPNVTSFDPKTPVAKQFRIIPANPGRVAVSFPADKETSGLRFHLHAPFVPELSRASVKDTPANESLFEQLAELAAAALQVIRDLGLLTPEFLAVLPNPQDTLPPRYEPIRDSIIEEMNEKPLTPTHSKSHAPAKTLLQARAALKDLLTEKDIEFLVDYDDVPPKWAIAASQKNSNSDRFLSALGIKAWDIDSFLKTLTLKASAEPRYVMEPYWTMVQAASPGFMAWLSSKDLEWHQELYALLYSEIRSKPDYQRNIVGTELKLLKIVRLENGKYSPGPNCFFPTDGVNSDDAFPQVDARIYSSGKSKSQQDDSKKFLQEVGVREVGEADQVLAILKARYSREAEIPDEKTYSRDLDRFIALVNASLESSKLFTPYYIFKAAEGDWHTPDSVYLDSPLMETGLSAYYLALGKDSTKSPLSPEYAQDPKRAPKFVLFAQAVGVATCLQLEQTDCYSNPQWSYLRSVPGERHTSPINRDWTIPGLEALLKKPTVDLSRLVWATMCKLPKHPNPLQACYRKNESNGCHYADSRLVHMLRSSAWVAQTNQTFVQPSKASVRILPKGFPYDDGYEWLSALRFGQEENKRSEEHRQQQTAAKDLGFTDVETLARAREFAALPAADQQRILAQFRPGQMPELPDNEPRNPERRGEKVGEQARDAPERLSEERQRAVQVGTDEVKKQAAEYLRAQYTNDGQTICQICKAPLPFKLDDGSYYFEKVEFLKDLQKRHYQNYLALCPNHSAMFLHANSSRSKLKEMFEGMQGQHLDVVLAQKNLTVYFTKTHIADLTKVIEVDAKPAAPPTAPEPQSTTASVPPPAQAHSRSQTQAPNNSAPATISASPLPNGLVQCPHCPSPVRPDRLQDHIARVHGNNTRLARLHHGRNSPPPPLRPRFAGAGTAIRRCPCGKPAVPGDDYCYSCRSD